MDQIHSDLQKGALRKRMYDFLDFHSLFVISTVGDSGIPESAIVEYVTEKDMCVYFGTGKNSRKAKNLLHYNTNVSAVIGFYEEQTMQYEGHVQLVKEDLLPINVAARLATRMKHSQQKEGEEVLYFKVVPRFIRLTDVSFQPWKIEEVEFSE